jgi:hypothetical protein
VGIQMLRMDQRAATIDDDRLAVKCGG